mmetsp:Transcript_102111/g.243520  ORF Transcript_102111/g.243520 Transcript_102111/m.243520 type:complete len:116 (+) Transcript_102111:258-605(+)
MLLAALAFRGGVATGQGGDRSFSGAAFRLDNSSALRRQSTLGLVVSERRFLPPNVPPPPQEAPSSRGGLALLRARGVIAGLAFSAGTGARVSCGAARSTEFGTCCTVGPEGTTKA